MCAFICYIGEEQTSYYRNYMYKASGKLYSVHGLMWLNAVFRDLMNINWRLFRDLLLTGVVSLSCARLLGLLFVFFGAAIVDIRGNTIYDLRPLVYAYCVTL
eukprot:4122058-Amphidinium_carterae.1